MNKKHEFKKRKFIRIKMLIKCQVCGKELNRKPSQIKKNKNQTWLSM